MASGDSGTAAGGILDYVMDGEAGKMPTRMMVDNQILHTAGGAESS